MRWCRTLTLLAITFGAAATLAEPVAATPSFVNADKRMSAKDLAKKREGWFVTALPFVSSDPLNGVGGGATGYLTANGARSHPLFAYAPYLARLGVTAGYSTGDSATLAAKLDVPYIAQTPWRLRLDLKYASSPNNVYFGLTESTLRSLPADSYHEYAASLATVRPGVNGEATRVADVYKHRFYEREWMLNAKLARVLFGGNWRVLVGYELQHLSYGTYDGEPVEATDPATGKTVVVPNGRSLLRSDAALGRVSGLQGGIVSLLQLSLMYDSRDFEPDPTRGLFVESAWELSAPVIFSSFTFAKSLLQVKFFRPILPTVFSRSTLAVRFGYGTIFGANAPFFEYQDQWTTEGSINALGGAQTLRGYKANRILGRTVAFGNVEVRHRVLDVDALGQNFTFTVTPFFDLGTIGDGLLVRFDKLRVAGGAGLRIGWNRSTIITIDYAISEEDQQLFVGFNKSY